VFADHLSKVYRGAVHALAGVSLSVNQGEFFAVLGPHGSGKTTLLRVFATAARADGGRACVLGYDVQDAPRQVRRRIGYLSQAGGLDPHLTCREQARLAARLQGLSRREATTRAERLLALLDLGALTDTRIAFLGPPARRRLALLCSIIHRPPLLLLDEPADDLGAEDRAALWRVLQDLNRRDEVTVLLATRHLDDADGLCGRVVLLDAGKNIASGAPDDLKTQAPALTVMIRLAAAERLATAAALLEHRAGVRAVWLHPEHLEVHVTGAGTAPMLLHFLEEHDIAVREIAIRPPSLEDVFFRHAGRTSRDRQPRPSLGSGVTGRR
jgi:ABC-2 type transport system ATP-binding protein